MIHVTDQSEIDAPPQSRCHYSPNEGQPVAIECFQTQIRELFRRGRDIGPAIHGNQNLALSKIEALDLIERATHHAVVDGYPAVRAERCGLKQENQC